MPAVEVKEKVVEGILGNIMDKDKLGILLLSILVRGIRNIIGIQTGINTTPESLGISDKQFYAVKKRNCGYYTLDKLIKIYEMLTNLEYQYKFGGLTQENLADYIVVKMLEED